MWLNRHKHNNSLVVFIHGLFGNRWATWKGVPELLQREAVNDPLIRSYDLYLFQYQTGLLRQPPIDRFAVSMLGDFLRREDAKYDTQVLIGHSQGGILAKLYVLRTLLGPDWAALKVDQIITLGTPHRGVRLLNPILWLRMLPILKRTTLWCQIGELASLSPTIKYLHNNWEQCVSPVPCRTAQGRRHLGSTAAIGAYDALVREESAADLSDQRHFVDDQGHSGMAKPSPSQQVTDVLLDELRRHRNPAPILDRIRVLQADASQRNGYLTAHADAVAQLVRLARPGLSLEGVEMKTVTLMLDFLEDYPKRPLRALDLSGSLSAYTKRALGNET